MEKITVQSTYSRVSLYARFSSGANGGAAQKPAGEADPAKAGLDAAAATGANGSNGATGTDGAKGLEYARSKDGDTFSLSIEARTLRITETYTVESEGPAQAGAAQNQTPKAGKQRHHFPQLSDPQDLAEHLLAQITARHAAQGGSKADFAADIKKKLDDWKPSAGRLTVEYQEFRSEVHMELVSGLDAWTEADADPQAPIPPQTGPGEA